MEIAPVESTSVTTDANPSRGHTEKWSALARRTKIISVALLIGLMGLLLFGIILIGLKLSTSSPKTCTLSETRPDIRPIKYIKSDDNIALVGLTGYIEFKSGSFGPIELTGVETSPITEGTLMQLSSGCANMDFYYLKSDEPYVETIQVDLVRDTPNGNICRLEVMMSANQDQHYACNKSLSYDCMRNNTLVATVVFTKLEFELYGNPENVNDYKFSTTPLFC